ncbi:MAG: hypothetical protein Q8O08_04755 [Methyloversatilis sp.]|uniref:hypothetical protein n=1 Tax=Methyloversatilis sp. TaxID=2569862 RepID=UPI0027332393|nr:hypothetical protein [Methyloversatilis sp.]MDP2868115.1 hypothetical protein [Methyloversatilis sp.]MDP3578519.1 hypothetical protein [Methyloversatilis sp.]
MNLAVKLTLAASGIFLFVGLIGGILKYRGIMTSPNHRAHPYIDIAHRASLLYSFAALVMAALLTFSPYSDPVQILITGVPLFFFSVAIAQYYRLGLEGKVTNQFKERNFNTTWGMLLLIVGELGGVGAIVWGFISTQFLG